ncbi:MAG TPA: response regulator [Candidatus Binatia bacterium]|nr:response regulator [Candidatus Binatia bacterium]
MAARDAGTVFVLDDDASMRDSLRWLIQSVGLSVEAFGSASDFLATYQPERSGCLVLDVRMRGMSGLELQEELARRGISIPTIIVTGHADVPMAVRAMKAGALDFLEKPFSDQALLDRIHRALEIDRSARRSREERADVLSRLAVLTRREREIVDLLVDGKANKEIAAELGLSTRTVEGHRAHIMDKVGAASFAELVRMTLLAREQAAED